MVTRILNRLVRWHSGPEKAGVGGSIPSLATTFFQSLTDPCIKRFCSVPKITWHAGSANPNDGNSKGSSVAHIDENAISITT